MNPLMIPMAIPSCLACTAMALVVGSTRTASFLAAGGAVSPCLLSPSRPPAARKRSFGGQASIALSPG